jgi:hypothetical protein
MNQHMKLTGLVAAVRESGETAFVVQWAGFAPYHGYCFDCQKRAPALLGTICSILV